MATINYKEKYEKAVQAAMLAKQDTESAITIGILETIFPELKESEDERIRNALVELVHDTTGDSLWADYNVHKEDALAWLEKQGEQKPTWNEEDEEVFKSLKTLLNNASCYSCTEGVDRILFWLKSIKERVQPQQKQEWSEDDIKEFKAELQSLMFEWSNKKVNMGVCIDRHIDKLLSILCNHTQSQ